MNIINNDIFAFILTVVMLILTYFCLKNSKYYEQNSLGYMFMYVSAPVFLLSKWILEVSGDYNNYVKYTSIGLMSMIILYFLFTAKKNKNKKDNNID